MSMTLFNLAEFHSTCFEMISLLVSTRHSLSLSLPLPLSSLHSLSRGGGRGNFWWSRGWELAIEVCERMVVSLELRRWIMQEGKATSHCTSSKSRRRNCSRHQRLSCRKIKAGHLARKNAVIAKECCRGSCCWKINDGHFRCQGKGRGCAFLRAKWSPVNRGKGSGHAVRF